MFKFNTRSKIKMNYLYVYKIKEVYVLRCVSYFVMNVMIPDRNIFCVTGRTANRSIII